jgi:hypothetical protein
MNHISLLHNRSRVGQKKLISNLNFFLMPDKLRKSACLFFILFLAGFLPVRGQLAHTTWTGSMNLETTTQVFWRFDKDSTQVFTVRDSSLVEKMTFKTESGILYLTRVEGISSCDNQTVGKYKYTIRDDKLYFTLVADSCTDRSNAISSDPYLKIK